MWRRAEAAEQEAAAAEGAASAAAAAAGRSAAAEAAANKVGRCRLIDPIKPVLKPPGTKHLKLKCGMLPSTSAFEFSLRRFNKGWEEAEAVASDSAVLDAEVGRRRLTASNLELKPRLVSALET
jgi:hypothetical protein